MLNQLLRTRTSRLVSYLLILTMAVPVWMAALIATPAQAQTPGMVVGVIDFRNESGVQGEMLSRLATDAVALELAKHPVYDILPRTQIAQQMKQLGITTPISKIGLSRLGEALFAEAMVEGAIRQVEVRGTGGNRRAAVTLVVRMLDQASGEVINGGVQTGYSNVRVGFDGDDDALIAEAIDNAAFLVVKTMAEYIIPTATVLNSVGQNQVLINKGSRDGIKRGMRMIVKRDKEIIGYISIDDARPNDATATVARAMRGVRAEDKVQAIFDMPAVSEVRTDPNAAKMGAPPVKKSARMTKGKNVLLALLAVAGLAALINGGSGNEDPGSASVAQLQRTPGAPPEVVVKWNSSNLSSGKSVVAAHVWRSDVPTPILETSWSNGSLGVTDSPAPRDVDYVTADPQTKDEINGSTSVPAMQYGRTYTYQVSALYTVNSIQQEKLAYYESDRSMAGRITLIAPMVPADLLLPASGDTVRWSDHQSPMKFQWNSKQGADRYIVQVSPKSDFKDASVIWSNISRPIQWSPDIVQMMEYTPDSSAWIDLWNKFNNWVKSAPGDDLTVWWRVGYCNSSDTSFDGTVNSYLFSPPANFLVPKLPPASP